MEDKDQRTLAWKEAITGKTIEDIRLVMITEHYLEYEDDRIWLSDGALRFNARMLFFI